MRFDTSVKYGLVGGICRIVRADVTLNVTITLPRWDASRPPTDPYLAVVWDVLSKDIRRHEERHVAIADDHAKRLERGLRRLPPTKGCERLKRKVEETTQAELKKEEADQAGFDRSEQAGFNARFTRLVNQRLKALSRN